MILNLCICNVLLYRYVSRSLVLPVSQVIIWGWCEATKWREICTLCSYTCIMDPLLLEMAQKVVDDVTTRSCETLTAQ